MIVDRSAPLVEERLMYQPPDSTFSVMPLETVPLKTPPKPASKVAPVER
jgi:hypothetical protein